MRTRLSKLRISKYDTEMMVVAVIILLLANIAASGDVAIRPEIVGIGIGQSIELAGPAAFVDSYKSTENVYAPLTATSEAVVAVNSVTMNSVALFNNATINGDVYIGPGADVGNAVRVWDENAITGSVERLEEAIVLPKISVPDAEPFNLEASEQLYLSYQSETIDYDLRVTDFVVAEGSVVTIKGNVVIVVDGDFEVTEDSSLVIADGSTLDLYVYGDCYVSGRVNAEAGDPQALYWFMPGEDSTFDMSKSAAVFGVLQNPLGNVYMNEQTQFFGRIKANNLKSMGGIHVDLDSGFPTSKEVGGDITLESFENLELIAGTYFDINWDTDGGVDNVIIEYSVDGGSNWEMIDAVNNIGSYEWLVPEENSQSCHVRVLDASDASNGYVSEEFTVYVCQLLYDLNGDCRVDAEDAKIMAAEWLTCGNPFNPDCGK